MICCTNTIVIRSYLWQIREVQRTTSLRMYIDLFRPAPSQSPLKCYGSPRDHRNLCYGSKRGTHDDKQQSANKNKFHFTNSVQITSYRQTLWTKYLINKYCCKSGIFHVGIIVYYIIELIRLLNYSCLLLKY